ncbi:MAG: hypothetical protein R2716_02775 [Microthrixaceae bacterium]
MADAVSLGFLVTDSDPGRGGALRCRGRAAAGIARVEFLVLDDNTNPARRELVSRVDDRGDSVRLVPRAPGGLLAQLDAASLSSCSEYLVVPLGEGPPWGSIREAVSVLRGDGSDFVVVSGNGRRIDRWSCTSAWMPATTGTGRGSADGAPRLVLMRRWVARWLFSDMGPEASGDGRDRNEVDQAVEVADRAALLGLRVLELDPTGAVVGGN